MEASKVRSNTFDAAYLYQIGGENPQVRKFVNDYIFSRNISILSTDEYSQYKSLFPASLDSYQWLLRSSDLNEVCYGYVADNGTTKKLTDGNTRYRCQPVMWVNTYELQFSK